MPILDDDPQSLFSDDVREKKLIAASGRSGRRSIVSRRGVVMPLDFMSPQERRKHKKPGKVVRYIVEELILESHKDKLMDGETFFNQTLNTQAQLITLWRSNGTFSNRDVYRALGINEQKYYGILRSLGIGTTPRNDRKAVSLPGKTGPKGPTGPRKKADQEAAVAPIQQAAAPEPAALPVAQLAHQGMFFQFDRDSLDADKIVKQLLAVAALIEAQESKTFRVHLSVAEIL